MIRYTYIDRQILKIYCQCPTLSFPIDARKIIRLMPNCRYMSYQDFENVSEYALDEIIRTCGSEFGCSLFDVSNDRYLVLCNESTDNNNNVGRQRWTFAHELGHIICKHHAISACNKSSEFADDIPDSDFESEADYFAATLLAPFPLYKVIGIHSAVDVQKMFGLSREASEIRWERYGKWCRTRYKSAWENDMIRLYRERIQVS